MPVRIRRQDVIDEERTIWFPLRNQAAAERILPQSQCSSSNEYGGEMNLLTARDFSHHLPHPFQIRPGIVKCWSIHFQRKQRKAIVPSADTQLLKGFGCLLIGCLFPLCREICGYNTEAKTPCGLRNLDGCISTYLA